jgi:RNA polymerase sigma-70 factor (ECF subfamily)
MRASAPFATCVESPDQFDARTDQQLIAAINEGDAAAFEVLYRRHRDWVANLAFRFTDDEDLALDVLQETFIYVMKKFPGFRLTAQFRTFLYPAVKNLSITAQRKARRHQSTAAEQELLDTLPAVEASASSRPGELAAALAGLSEDHREVLLLRFRDGLALNEIAAAMEVPLGTVKSRLHNALDQLRTDPRTKQFFDE